MKEMVKALHDAGIAVLVVDGVVYADAQARRHHGIGRRDVHRGIARVGAGLQLVKNQGDVGLHARVAVDERLGLQAFHREGLAVRQRVVFGQQDHQLVLADGQPDRQRVTVADEAEIRAVVQQHLGQLAAGAVDDLDDHAGVPCAERRHHPGDPLIVAVIRRTDDNGAAVCAAHLGCGLFQPLLRKQQLTHRRQQLAAFRGGLHAAFGAVQQRKSQLLFQRCHAAADTGDRKTHLLRRRTQAAAVDCL